MNKINNKLIIIVGFIFIVSLFSGCVKQSLSNIPNKTTTAVSKTEYIVKNYKAIIVSGHNYTFLIKSNNSLWGWGK